MAVGMEFSTVTVCWIKPRGSSKCRMGAVSETSVRVWVTVAKPGWETVTVYSPRGREAKLKEPSWAVREV